MLGARTADVRTDKSQSRHFIRCFDREGEHVFRAAHFIRTTSEAKTENEIKKSCASSLVGQEGVLVSARIRKIPNEKKNIVSSSAIRKRPKFGLH